MSSRDDLLARFRGLLEEARATGDPELWAEMRRAVSEATVARPPADDADLPIWQGIVGACPAMLGLRAKIEKFAAVTAPVLLRGESGTGKDLVAHALHDLGPRASKPFVSENCAAIPETLLESVLFGHVRGAFTGAVRDHAGHFVAAHGGTLFLDEIGDTPASMQVKLLRVLQEGEVRPVGGSKVRKVDVRVVAATNQDLEHLVAEGKFREDLFYRLNVLQLELPPLRDRGHDIVILARFFLHHAATRDGRVLELDSAAEASLRNAPWPGNVRQLQNEMQRVAALSEGPVVTPAQLSL